MERESDSRPSDVKTAPSGLPQRSPTGLLTIPVFAGLVCAILVSNHRILDAFFLSDDFALVASFGRTGSWSQWPGGPGFLRPLVALSLSIDYRLYGTLPLGYHITSLLLHSANSLMVGAVATNLVRMGVAPDQDLAKHLPVLSPEGVGVLSAVVFALMPCHSESTAWISGRTDLVATFFVLVSLYLYLLPARFWSLLGTCTFFVLALFSKESVISYPLVLLLLEVLRARRSRPNRNAVARLALFALIALGYLLVRYHAIGSLVGGYGAKFHFGGGISRTTMGLAHGLVRVFFPWLPAGQLSHAMRLAALGAWGSVMCVAASRLWLSKDRSARRVLGFLGLALILTLLPAASLGVSLKTTDGERFLYWPSVFGAILLALLTAWVTRRRVIAFTFSSAMCLSLGVSLHVTNSTWRDAGMLSHNIVTDLRRLADGRPLIVANLPDTIRGAYVFRNGLSSAAELFSPPRGTDGVWPAVVHGVTGVADEVRVTRRGSSTQVELLGESMVFEGATDGDLLAGGRLKVQALSDRSVRLVETGNSPIQFLYYSRGHLHAAGSDLSALGQAELDK